MPALKWDAALAAKAQAHADKCSWGHSNGRSLYPNGESIVRRGAAGWLPKRAGVALPGSLPACAPRAAPSSPSSNRHVPNQTAAAFASRTCPPHSACLLLQYSSPKGAVKYTFRGMDVCSWATYALYLEATSYNYDQPGTSRDPLVPIGHFVNSEWARSCSTWPAADAPA